jgi:hypothetical protein
MRKVRIRVLLRRFFHPWCILSLLLFLLGIVITIRVLPNADTAPLTFLGKRAIATGVVTRIDDSGVSETVEDGPILTIWRHHYTYTVGGRTYQGVSYDVRRDEGKVEVEYLVAHPSRSRIEGMRMKTYTFTNLIVGFALASLGFPALYFSLLRSFKHVSLLLRGTLVQAPVARTRGDDLTFYFITPDGQRIEVPTRDYDVATFRAGLGQRVLYDPAKPSRWLVLRPDE